MAAATTHTCEYIYTKVHQLRGVADVTWYYRQLCSPSPLLSHYRIWRKGTLLIPLIALNKVSATLFISGYQIHGAKICYGLMIIVTVYNKS